MQPKSGLKSTETGSAAAVIAACIAIASQADSETIVIGLLAVAGVVALGYAYLRTRLKQTGAEK